MYTPKDWNFYVSIWLHTVLQRIVFWEQVFGWILDERRERKKSRSFPDFEALRVKIVTFQFSKTIKPTVLK